MIAPQITTSPLEKFALSEVFFLSGVAKLLKDPPLQSVNRISQKWSLRAKGGYWHRGYWHEDSVL